MFTLLFAAACQAGSAVAGLDPRDPVLNPIIVSIDLRTARSSYATDEAALIEAKGRLNTGQTVDAETEWVALDGGTVRSVGDGSEALFSSTSTGTFRVAGKGKGWGRGGSGGGTGGTSDTTTAPVDTVTIIVEPAPAPIATISVTPASDTVYRGRTEQFLVSATRTDGSTASPAVTWRATGGTVDAGGYYTAPSTDGQHLVIATTTDGALADTSRVAVTVPPNNEPAGFTRLFEKNFSSMPGVSGGDLAGRSSIVYRDDEPKAPNMFLASDASAPTSGPSVFRTRFPAGLEAGKEPGAWWFWPSLGTSTAPRYKQVYLSFWMKIQGQDFENQGVLTKLFYFGYGADYSNNDFTIGLNNGTGTNQIMRAMRLAFVYRSGGPGTSQRLDQNITSEALVTAGSWHHIELYMNVGTVDNYDGVGRMWVDGRLVFERTNLRFLDSSVGYVEGFYEAQFTPVWGGAGTPAKTRDDYIDIDHVYLSGRN